MYKSVSATYLKHLLKLTEGCIFKVFIYSNTAKYLYVSLPFFIHIKTMYQRFEN